MDNIIFDSQESLFNRVLPALRVKRRLMNKNGFKFITEEEIWTSLKKCKWAQEKGLMLCDMVDDILNTDEVLIVSTFKENNLSSDSIELPKLK